MPHRLETGSFGKQVHLPLSGETLGIVQLLFLTDTAGQLLPRLFYHQRPRLTIVWD